MRRLFTLSLVFIFSLSLYAYGADAQDKKQDTKEEEGLSSSYAGEIGILTGYAHGNLKRKGSYKVIPGIARVGFNLNPLIEKLNVQPKGFTELLLEPFVNTVTTPHTNVETGCGILLKYSYPVTQKIHPYVLGGVGMAFLSQHSVFQSTHWGFTPQAGGGISYFFMKNTALNLEYRFRHFSNAGIRQPNDGINLNMFLVGISCFY